MQVSLNHKNEVKYYLFKTMNIYLQDKLERTSSYQSNNKIVNQNVQTPIKLCWKYIFPNYEAAFKSFDTDVFYFLFIFKDIGNINKYGKVATNREKVHNQRI